MAKTYIQKLFDAINGGDCVDSANEAEITMAELLSELKINHRDYMKELAANSDFPKHNFKKPGNCPTCQLIAKAEGR